MQNKFLSLFCRKHFSILREEGQVTVSLSKAWFFYAFLVLALTVLISLLVFGYIYFYFPPIETRQAALVVCAAVGVLLLGMMIAAMIMGALKVYTFDRTTDRVLRRGRFLCHTADIDHIQIDRYAKGSDSQAGYNLSIFFRGGKKSPAEELCELGDTIADYLGVRLVKPEN